MKTKFQIEMQDSSNKWHSSPVFSDDLEAVKNFVQSHSDYFGWFHDCRIRNNFTQELSYRAGHNWLTFAK